MENINLPFAASRSTSGRDEIIFLHANGYPPDCYQPLLGRLSEKYHLTTHLMRPLREGYSPNDLDDWRPLSQDLKTALKQSGKKRINVVGHSLGAVVSLRAAMAMPENFRAIILIDPVIFPPVMIQGWKVIKKIGLGYKLHPLIPTARKRRTQFDNLDVMYRAYRQKEVFRSIDNDKLRILINGMVKPSPRGGFELAYSPEWEVQIYYTGVAADMDLWEGFTHLEIPVLIIRGDKTNTFLSVTASKVKRANPAIQIETIKDATHLVPLERPEEVANAITTFMETVQ